MVAWSFSSSSDNSTIDNQLPSLRETPWYWLSYRWIARDIVTPLNPTITAPLLPQLVCRTDMKCETTSGGEIPYFLLAFLPPTTFQWTIERSHQSKLLKTSHRCQAKTGCRNCY
ncbi:hypothetical protein AVEN_194390-1 [Araneus ventricosus]|uniref:Uncharacterized protein n=1 Tax=Araneus ventricosus TaxID=182803 RepID=A0A4Y2A888_ARAVE|nr:hypothetical protein AVEN_194390-1 [Araneus ventricosus]